MNNYNTNRGYSSVLLEEIGLEGLDGITFEILLVRLSNNPNWFLKPIDSFVEEFIWKKLVVLSDIFWYNLPTPRECPIIFSNIEEYLEAVEKGKINVSNFSANAYPYCLVKDGEIVGSCPFYYERVNITDEVQKLSLSEAKEKWGNKLIMVASQDVRNHLLLGNIINPEVEIGDLSYCILERIGRARRCGELSTAILFMKSPGNIMYYFWNKLRNWKLITCQSVHISEKNTYNTLFYLTKFHQTYRNEVTDAMTAIIEKIKASPNGGITLAELKPLIPSTRKKFLKTEYFRRHIEISVVPHKQFYPGSSAEESETKKGTEKNVYVYKLSNKSKNLSGKIELNSQADNSDEDEKNILEENRIFNRPIISQVYNFINSSGTKGVTMLEIGYKLGLHKLIRRSVIRLLEKYNFIFSILTRDNRYECYIYYSTNYKSEVEKEVMQNIKRNEITESIDSTNSTLIDQKTDKIDSCEMEIVKNDSIETGEYSDSSKIKKRKLDDANKNDECTAKRCKETTSLPNNNEKKLNNEKQTFKLPIEITIPTVKSISMMRRINIILEYIYKNQVVSNHTLVKTLKEAELKLGLSTGTPDRKSINRIIDILTTHGKIKRYKKVITDESVNKKKEISLLCAMDVNEDHPLIQRYIRDVKRNLSILCVKYSPKLKMQLDLPKPMSNKDWQKYGYSPKFARMKILHELLVYLVYHYEGSENLNVLEYEDFIRSVYKDLDVNENIPKCYVKELSWKMFIPPLMNYEEYSDGWISQTDLVDRIPIKTFFSIVNLRYEAYGIEEYLNHPIKQLYLVRHLPNSLQRILSLDRKYLDCLYRDLKYLCMIGLIQFGPNSNIRGTSNLVYVNKNAKLVDTRSCPPSYSQIDPNIKYPVHYYDFSIAKSIDKYWNDSFLFSSGTKLGFKKSSANIPKTKASVYKPELLRAIEVRTVKQAPILDTGEIPGDHLGAAGYDSSLFSHYIKHWVFTNTQESYLKINQEPIQIPKVKIPIQKKSITKQKQQRISLRKKLSITNKKPKASKSAAYDSVDVEALKKLRTLRVNWTKREDDLLLLCHLASLYYKDNRLQKYKPFKLFRKLMHNVSERSADKTTGACKRRIYNLMKSSLQQHNMNLNLKDLLLKEDLNIKCRDIIEEMKSQDSKDLSKIQSLTDKLTETVFYYLYENNKDVSLILKDARDSLQLPNSVKEFREQFHVEYPNTSKQEKNFLYLRNEKDIEVSVIINSIFSTLMSQIDKNQPLNVNQMYSLFKQFDDEQLKAAHSYVRIHRMISYNKYIDRERGSYLPFGRGNYHLSLSFHVLMKSIFNTKIFSYVYSRYLDFLSMVNSDIDIVNYDVGMTLLIIAYYINNNQINFDLKIPENIMIFDARLSEIKPEEIVKPILTAKASHTDMTLSLICKSFFNNKQSTKNKLKEIAAGSFDEKKLDEYSTEESDPETDINLEQDLDDLVKLYGRRSKIAAIIAKTHFKYNDRFPTTYDHFLLNVFPVKMKTSVEDIEILPDHICNNLLKEIQKSVIFKKIMYNNDELLQKIKMNFQESHERDYGVCVLEYLLTNGPIGATYKMLAEEFQTVNSLKKVMNVLLKKKMILRVGTEQTHFVHINFSKHWLALSYNYSKADDSKTMQEINRNEYEETVTAKEHVWILIKPWIHFSGELNEPALICFLIRILMHVLKNPAISLKNLQVRFFPALQPHYVRELVEMLDKLTVVQMKSFKMSKITLFSKSAEFCISDNISDFEDENNIFIEPEVNALVKLSIFIKKSNYEDLFEKKYSTDVSSTVNQPSKVEGEGITQDGD